MTMKVLSLRNVLVSLIVIVGIAALLWKSNYPGPHNNLHIGDGTYPIQQHYRYRFLVSNEGGDALENVGIHVAMPYSRTSVQETRQVDTSLPYETKVDKHGNKVMSFRVDRLPPYGKKRIEVDARLGFSPQPNAVDLDDPDRYLGAEPQVEVTAPEVQSLASKLKADDPFETARNVYQWASDYVKYKSYIRQDRGALYALNNRIGDCTEAAALFTALARANRLPTRRMAGYVAERQGVLNSGSYHNWAEFYYQGVWWIADPQRKVFADSEPGYMALRVIDSGVSLTPLTGGGIASADSDVTVVMN